MAEIRGNGSFTREKRNGDTALENYHLTVILPGPSDGPLETVQDPVPDTEKPDDFHPFDDGQPH